MNNKFHSGSLSLMLSLCRRKANPRRTRAAFFSHPPIIATRPHLIKVLYAKLEISPSQKSYPQKGYIKNFTFSRACTGLNI